MSELSFVIFRKHVSVLLLAGCLLAFAALEGHTREIVVTMHPQASCQADTSVVVSFGMPFPKDFIADASLIRVKNQSGEEMPAYVRTILPWRDISTGNTLSSIRSVLIQTTMTFTSASDVKDIIVETGYARTLNMSSTNVRDTWAQEDDTEFPAAYGVFEPRVYVTLPPAWMGECQIKGFTVPYGTYSDFSYYDNSLTNEDPGINSGQNFFKTMINDEVSVSTTNQIHYRDPGEYEPWLYDRAMTMYMIYIRSGNVKVLRSAHRAAYFYASHIKNNGFFDIKTDGDDLKYSYGESILTDLMLIGDEGNVDKIEKVTLAADTFNPTYSGSMDHGIWTERHVAFSWLAYITAFETTGKAAYSTKARSYADTIFYHQSHPPSNATHGQAPFDGALMHSFAIHEGYWSSQEPFWIFSPFMTVLVVDAMERYYQHSGDTRVIDSAKKFGDAMVKCGSRMPKAPGCEPIYSPWYLTSSTSTVGSLKASNGDDYDDYNHSVDVCKTLAYAYYLSGHPKYKHELEYLLTASTQTLAYWIRPNAHATQQSIYRLGPARKAGWWFRTTADVDYLLHASTPMAGSYSISGYIRNASGTGIGGVTLYLAGDLHGSVVTGNNGYFQFNNLIDGDSYSLTLAKDYYTFSPASRSISSLSGNTVLNFTASRTTASENQIVTDVVRPGEVKVVGPIERQGVINPDKGDTARIFFKGTEAGEFTCRIFTLAGEQVWENTKDNVSEGMFEWVPKNMASGGYVVFVSGPGVRVKKKLAILR